MASFHLQDPAKWVQLSCKKETPRWSSGASISLVLGHVVPSPGASRAPDQQCSPPHKSPQVDGSQLPSATCWREVKGNGGQAGSPSPRGGEEKAWLLLLQQGQRPASRVRPSPSATSTQSTTTTTDMCAMRVLPAVKFPRRHQGQQQSPSLS